MDKRDMYQALGWLLALLILLAVAAHFITADGKAQDQHCRDLGGTPTIVYGRETCWPGR